MRVTVEREVAQAQQKREPQKWKNESLWFARFANHKIWDHQSR
jgi:hypothetical protein